MPHQLGRPQRVDDGAVFTAVRDILLEVGYGRLTLAMVAARLGVTPAAIRQRFGAKRDLLLSFYEWRNTLARKHATRVRGTSSLSALWELVLAQAESVNHPEALANALSVVTDVVSDPDLRSRASEGLAIYRDRYRELLQAAVDAGELPPRDVSRLAWVLAAAVTGVHVHWAVTGDGELADQLRECFDTILHS
jgi:AcrR family transcriptional regulator